MQIQTHKDNFQTHSQTRFKSHRSKAPYPAAALVKDKSRYVVTIFRKSKEELFSYWRNFENLSRFMKGIESIVCLSEKKSIWRVKLESGLSAQWTAIVSREIENEQISWKSTDDSEVQTNGTVWFMDATNGMGTVVGLNMDYKVPGGKLAEFFTSLTGEDPKTLTQINLKRFKALMETGEVPTIEGQADGREGELK